MKAYTGRLRPKECIFQAKIGISQVELYEKVGKSVF